MELSLRVVASSLAVCLFITTVANEHIRLKDESRMLKIIKWNVRNEKVWDITTAIDNEFIFLKLHAFATLSICSSGTEFSRTTRRWVLLLSSDNNHLVLRISINFYPLSSSKGPVQAWSRDHPDSGSKKICLKGGTAVSSLPVCQIYYVKVRGLYCCHFPPGVLALIRKL